jgi:phosphomannomutase
MSKLIESFSGIRGIWGDSLTDDICRRYGFAYGQWLQKHHASPVVVIGADTRPSRPYVKRALETGLAAAGITEIIDVGILSTPAVENAVRAFSAAGGIIITASHNPAEHNGMKFLQVSGAVLTAADAEAIIAASKQPVPPGPRGRMVGLSDQRGEAISAYLAHVEASTGLTRDDIETFHGRVLFDPNGGAASETVISFSKYWTLPADFYHELPGDFWRAIEPKAESLAPLAQKLADEGLAFACAFDCDADRMEIVLPLSSAFARRQGTPVVSGQYVLGLVTRAILETRPETRALPIITNDATSQLVAAVASRFNTPVVEVEVGETNVVTQMLEQGSVIGGEGSSGGSIVAPGQCRDGLQALAVILKYLAKTGQSLDDALLDLPAYTTLATKVQCDGEKQLAVRQGLIAAYQKNGARVVTTGGNDGGVKAWVADDAWVWFRASKTELGIFRCIVDTKDRPTATVLLEKAKVVFDEVAAKS